MKKSLGPRTLAFPTPVWVVGTYDANGKANAMTAAWGCICCSKPPCIAVSLRQATYSYGNLKARGAFTVSVPSETYIKEADYFGIVSGREVNKFDRAHLTPVSSTLVDAPFVGEFPLVLECKVIHTIEIGLHTQFIGEILDVKADEAVLNKGFPDIEKVRPIIFGPEVRSYHGIGKYLGQAFSLGRDL